MESRGDGWIDEWMDKWMDGGWMDGVGLEGRSD